MLRFIKVGAARYCAVLIGLCAVAFMPVHAGAGSISALGRLVVVGDSLGAGFQNFSLFDSDTLLGAPMGGQKHGFANLVAEQAGADLQLPLIAYPGIPPTLTLSGLGVTRGTITGTREPATLGVQTLDLAVPGFTVANALSYLVTPADLSRNPESVLALEVLGYPALLNPAQACGVAPQMNGSVILSEVACAVQLRPNTVIVEIGNNDALQAVTTGAPPTRVAQFSVSYQQVMSALSRTGAKLVLGNIPDVTATPFLFSYAQFEQICGMPPAGAMPGDYLVLRLTDPNQSSFNVCTSYAVRPAALIAQAQASVTQFNDVIEHAAAQYRAVLVDVNGLFKQIAAHGYDVAGRHLTTAFLGGIFSLDGIHPTNTGYAILANQYIGAIDSQLHLSIPLVSVADVAATDPLL